MTLRKTLTNLILIVSLLFLPLFGVSASAPQGAATRVVRLPAEAQTELASLGLTPLKALDYGAFLWLELSAADYTRLSDADLPFETVADPFTLTLGGITFDPLQSSPNLPSGWQSAGKDGPDLHLVQLIGPTMTGWLETLTTRGVKLVQYIHPFTYVVWTDVSGLKDLQGLGFIRWTGDFAPAYRVLPQWRTLGSEPVAVNVMLYRGADVDAAIRQISALGGLFAGRAVIDNTFEIAGFILPGDRFQSAASIAGVYSIQPVHTDGGLRGEMSNQVNVGNYNASNQAFPGYLDWLNAVGLHGAGVIMANVDGGVDQSHPDLVNRIIPCTGTTCGGSAIDDHGTHTAGIMAADGASGVVDSYGFLRGLGMAPGANLVEQVYYPYYTYPGGMLQLMTDSFNNAAVLSSNSWGPSGSPQGYDDDTRQVDVGVRDAVPTAAGNQAFNYILSFMNGNGGTSSQGTPDEAKNIFTIGSTKMQTSGGAQILQIDDLSSNSAHGPALDGRTIPHMVAPGCSVDSTVPGGYDTMCGTSMSSPHVSGAVALFIEYFRDLFGVDPSPALVKASFIPVAHDLAGHYDADGNVMGHPFDSKQGWGRMDAAAVVSPTVEVHYFDNPIVFGNTGETWEQNLSVLDPTQPLRVMLVWTDAPGHGLGGTTPAWNNNLDLEVIAETGAYKGNVFGASGWSVTGGTADGKNNTEGVFLGPAASGAVTLRVVAANISSDGIPNNADLTDQDFAIVCYNCTLGPDFTLDVTPLSQEVCAPADASFDLTFGEILGFADPVTITPLGLPAGSSAAFTQNPATPPASVAMTVTNPITTAWGSYAVDIVAASATKVHTATVGLDVYTGLPETPALLSPASEAANVPRRPAFDWAAEQGQTFDLEVATDAGFTNIVIAAAALTQTTYTPAFDLSLDTAYYWRVQAHNTCGDSLTSPVSRFLTEPALGACSQGRVPVTVLTEGFETGAAGWSTNGGVPNWSQSSARKHSGGFSFMGLDVSAVSDQRLMSPVIALPAGQTPLTLQYWNYQNLQNRAGGCSDGGILEVSTDGGGVWTQIETQLLTDPYDGPLGAGTGNPLAGANAWCGKPQPWTLTMVNLDEFAGQSVQFRFRLATDNSIAYEGWYVDDVTVQACAPSASLAAPDAAIAMPGETVTHVFTFTNDGPTDSYQLSLTGADWPAAILGDNPVTVGQGDSLTVTVAVTAPLTFGGRVTFEDDFTLTATSASVPGLSFSAEGQTQVPLTPDVSVSASQDALSGQPGDTLIYTLTVTNHGNYTDTFTLAVSGVWTATLSDNSTGPLGANESMALTLEVIIPLDASPGQFDVAGVTVTSTLDTDVSVNVTLRSSVPGGYRVYLPVVIR